MAYRIIGHDAPAVEDGGTGGMTMISLVTPSPIRGIVKEMTVYAHAPHADNKAKIFRDVGADWVFVSECGVFDIVNGVITWRTWMPVETGDYLGAYFPGGANEAVDLANAGVDIRWYKAGDITTTSAKATWTVNSWKMQMGGKVFSRVAPSFVRRGF